MLGEVVSHITVQHVTCTKLIDPDIKRRIDNSDEKLERRFDDRNFVDDVGADIILTTWMNPMKGHMWMVPIPQVVNYKET